MINPTGKEIRYDSAGAGCYGASRGGRPHKGVDFECKPGQAVRSPITGTVVRIAQPYPNTVYKGLFIQGENIAVKLFYLDPETDIIGQDVKQGDVIGIAQDISAKYGGTMKPHIHLEVDSIDPMILINPED